jgi:chromosome segregation ATPase
MEEEDDDDDVEFEDDDFEKENFTQEARLDKGFAESGIITKIVLKRFMSHEHFTVNLAPNVNFIHGENGSGKSAILVALQFCLGSSASATNRADSLGGLVKRGENEGEVLVTLKNEGFEAYRPDVYGKSITIARKISKTASGGAGSSYRIYGE